MILPLILGILAGSVVSDSIVSSYADSSCQQFYTNFSIPDGYTNGICTRLQLSSESGSFKILNVDSDAHCVVTIYGSDTTTNPCSGSAIVGVPGTCYNAVYRYGTVDDCVSAQPLSPTSEPPTSPAPPSSTASPPSSGSQASTSNVAPTSQTVMTQTVDITSIVSTTMSIVPSPSSSSIQSVTTGTTSPTTISRSTNVLAQSTTTSSFSTSNSQSTSTSNSQFTSTSTVVPSSSSGLSPAQIGGIIGGGIVGLLVVGIIAGLIVWYKRHKRHKHEAAAADEIRSVVSSHKRKAPRKASCICFG